MNQTKHWKDKIRFHKNTHSCSAFEFKYTNSNTKKKGDSQFHSEEYSNSTDQIDISSSEKAQPTRTKSMLETANDDDNDNSHLRSLSNHRHTSSFDPVILDKEAKKSKDVCI
jgi:hypothetical protein